MYEEKEKKKMEKEMEILMLSPSTKHQYSDKSFILFSNKRHNNTLKETEDEKKDAAESKGN